MASIKGKKILVTGGLGFIGGFVTELLLRKGATVSVTATRKKSEYGKFSFMSDVKVITGDLRQADFALKALRGQEMVFHLAALKVNAEFYDNHPAGVLLDNTLMTTSLFEAARVHHPDKIVVTSSVRAANPPPLPRGSYGWAKKIEEIFAESFSLEHGISTTVVKLPNTFGPRDDFGAKAQVIPGLIQRVAGGEDPLLLSSPPGTTVEFVPVRAAAEAVIRAAEKKSSFSAVEVQGTEVSVKKLAETILSLFGKTSPVQFAGGGKEKTSHLRLPRDFEKALVETVQWYKSSAHE